MLEYELSQTGIGSTLSILSMLLHSGEPITLHTPVSNTTLREIKKIFQIEQLTIVDKQALEDDLILKCTDKGKFFSPYLCNDNLVLFGKQYPVSNQRKPCIGLATWDLQYEFANNAFPYNRLYSKEFWSKIFQLVQSAGYDVITFNRLDTSVEQKVWQLNELCDCVIGYEGGMCHLAHILSIPTVIMPWHHYEDGRPPEPDMFYVPQKLHLDPKTYFVKDEQEILSWTPTYLAELITQLHDSQGNSVFFNSDLIINPPNLKSVTIKTVDGQDLHIVLSRFELDFIKKYIKNIAVAGIKYSI